MPRRFLLLTSTLLATLVALPSVAAGDEAKPAPSDSFFSRSLHFTNRGIEFLYSKEQGGVGLITGLTASQAGCVQARCHVTSCDTCHRKDAAGKPAYSLDPAVAEAACAGCHDPAKPEQDVHARKGMKCMSCHSVREVHGDGVVYDTYSQPGALDTRCETCHQSAAKTASHTVHRGRLDCTACHSDEPESCLNCHLDAVGKAKKDNQIPLKGLLFLVNHDGRVTTANVLSFVAGKKTMITLAPTFTHSIRREGRKCADCHGTAIVKQLATDSFVPAKLEDGKITNVVGVVPVIDGMTWRLPFLDRAGDTWAPVAGAEPPLVHFSGNCTPLTKEQLARLVELRTGH